MLAKSKLSWISWKVMAVCESLLQTYLLSLQHLQHSSDCFTKIQPQIKFATILIEIDFCYFSIFEFLAKFARRMGSIHHRLNYVNCWWAVQSLGKENNWTSSFILQTCAPCNHSDWLVAADLCEAGSSHKSKKSSFIWFLLIFCVQVPWIFIVLNPILSDKFGVDKSVFFNL